ncbi:CD59 glycoprotein-like [Hoplias malabaricus]|uniref:CD59 glycoprotein-like n=1 Tax=Hoplias malabaricus TaxID=27720 RepID=UPI00346306D0
MRVLLLVLLVALLFSIGSSLRCCTSRNCRNPMTCSPDLDICIMGQQQGFPYKRFWRCGKKEECARYPKGPIKLCCVFDSCNSERYDPSY